MTYETYDLFVNGLKPNTDAEQAKNSLAKHFKTSPDKLDAFFRGLIDANGPEKIQQGLSHDVAQKNQTIIENMGLFCTIEPSLTLTSITYEEEEASHQCPACGHKQNLSVNNSDICEACGIVGKKYLDKESDSSLLKQEKHKHKRMKKFHEQDLQEQIERSNQENKIKSIRKQLEKKDRKSATHPLALGAIAISVCGILAVQFYNGHTAVVPDVTEEKYASTPASVDTGTKDQATSIKAKPGLTQDQAIAKIDQLQQALPSIDNYPSSNQEVLTNTKGLNAVAGTDISYSAIPSIESSQITSSASQMEANHNTVGTVTSRQTSVDVNREASVVSANSQPRLTQNQAVAKIDQLQQLLPSTDGDLSSNQDSQIQINGDKDASLLDRFVKIIDNNKINPSKDIAESIDEPREHTLALINTFNEKLILGDSAGAKLALNEAVQLVDTIISPVEQIKSYGLIASAFGELQDSSNAQRIFDKALVYANRLADPVDRVSSLTIVGGYQAASGDKEAARESFKLAQSFAAKNIVNSEVRNTAYQVIALNRAITADFQEALKTADKITQPFMRTGIIKKLADIQSRLGQQDDAKRTYSRALQNSVHILDVLQRRQMLDDILAALENVDAQEKK